MIVAHRLLKNDIEKHEYLLLSKPYLDSCDGHCGSNLSWQEGSEEYSAIGKVAYEFAQLEALRKGLQIPAPPPMETPPTPLPSARSIAVDIAAPMPVVYQNLIETDKRSIWVKGMTVLEQVPMPERIGGTHYCLSEGLGLDHTAVSAAFEANEISYIEKVVLRRWGLTVWDYYKVESLPDGGSRLSLCFAFRKPNFVTWIVEWIVLRNVRKDFGQFKIMCELGN